MVIEPSTGHTLYARRKGGTVVRLTEPGEKFSTIARMAARLQRDVKAPDAPFELYMIRDDSERLAADPVPCIFPHTPQRWRTLASLGADIAAVLGLVEPTPGVGFSFAGQQMGYAGLAATFIRSGHARRTSGGYEVIRIICED